MNRKDLSAPVIAEYPAIGYSVIVIDRTPADRPAYIDGDGNLWGVYAVAISRNDVAESAFFGNVDTNAFRLAEDLASGRKMVGPNGSVVSAQWISEMGI